MTYKIISSAIFLLFVFTVSAHIICPPDKTLTCHDDIHYLPLTGTPTVFGGSGQLRYEDQGSTNACNVGDINRIWYLDANGNQRYDNGEDACIQHLHIDYVPEDVRIDWPRDITLHCDENIPDTSPYWVSGPCDIVGVTTEDEIFRTGNEACYKIIRHFTVINWCTYDPSAGVGIWTHSQVIKIYDDSRPVIQTCSDVTIGITQGCETTFTVTNSAVDTTLCGDQRLLWYVDVDLYSDDSIDYSFTPDNFDFRFNLPKVKSGEKVRVTLPDSVGHGWHKVIWKVQDECGNVTSCVQKVMVKDAKKPTPYMYQLMSAAFHGKTSSLRVPARIFNVGSFDNCTQSSLLKYSFSPNVNDTIRVVDCSNAGFQFFAIYVTDREGNQEFAEVFMLVFDNGSCFGTLKLPGSITEANGLPIDNARLTLSSASKPNDALTIYSGKDGSFSWNDLSLYEDMQVQLQYDGDRKERVDIADLKMLIDYLLGRLELVDNEMIAADLNKDGKVNTQDLHALKQAILIPDKSNEDQWSYKLGASSASMTGETIQFQLKDLQSPLNLKGVYRGDITEANALVADGRNYVQVSKWYENGKILFAFEQDIDCEGIQIELLHHLGQKVQVTSSILNLDPASIFIDHQTVRVVLPKNFHINGKQAFLEVAADKSQLDDIWMTSRSKVVFDDYSTAALSMRNLAVKELTIIPNPAGAYFELNVNDAKVISIRNAAGSAMSFDQQGSKIEWNVPAGFYTVTVQTANGIEVKKVVKY
ncbi:MAG: T9SS type A sorting domain-containing protein [Saprospiraceae bacterium]|nr:MAG: Hyalin repeat-containing protein [Bacteroidetes bacterium OLB9]MCO6463078.1 T9SS type A sorting domain-containing protein [Saprospiraceae bacterium]